MRFCRTNFSIFQIWFHEDIFWSIVTPLSWGTSSLCFESNFIVIFNVWAAKVYFSLSSIFLILVFGNANVKYSHFLACSYLRSTSFLKKNRWGKFLLPYLCCVGSCKKFLKKVNCGGLVAHEMDIAVNILEPFLGFFKHEEYKRIYT